MLQGDQQGISSLLQGLALLTEACETGALASPAARWLCSASLIPLKKKTGNKVRPVAVGETLRRVVEKFLMNLPETKECTMRLQPHQLGCGFPSACELVGRSLQQTLEGAPLPDDWGILQLDLANAFNSVSRDAVLRGVAKWTPHLLPWAILSLGAPACLFSPLGTLKSAQGVQQGSPLGPLFFNAAIQDAITSCPGNLDWSVWYMDDGTLAGSLSDLQSAISHFQQTFRSMGLLLNLEKCTLWGPVTKLGHIEDTLLRTVTLVPWQPGTGIVLLGVPVFFPGDNTFLREHLSGVLEQLKASCCALTTKIWDSQTQLALLRGCFSACRFTFLLRSTPAAFTRDILQQADGVLRQTFETIVGSIVSDAQWLQTTLSFGEGGLGIDSPLIQGPAASVAGIARWTQAPVWLKPRIAPMAGLAGTVECLSWLGSLIGNDVEPLKTWAMAGQIANVESEHQRQAWWSGLIHKARRAALIQDSSARDSVRLRCQDSSVASAWSRAPPTPALGTKIGKSRFRIMIKWHLGMPVAPPSSAGKPCPQCGCALDIFGDHAVTCKKNNLWRRHFLIQDYMLRLTRAAGFRATREQSLMGTLQREADILIEDWDGTKAVAVDLTIRHPRAPGTPFGDPERVLLRAEEEKRAGADSNARSAAVSFEPLVLHTWAGMAATGSSKGFWSSWVSKVTENRPGADKERKISEIHEGFSCILFSQIAEQLLTIVGHTEIPVIPTCLEIAAMVDEYGNSVEGIQPVPYARQLRSRATGLDGLPTQLPASGGQQSCSSSTTLLTTLHTQGPRAADPPQFPSADTAMTISDPQPATTSLPLAPRPASSGSDHPEGPPFTTHNEPPRVSLNPQLFPDFPPVGPHSMLLAAGGPLGYQPPNTLQGHEQQHTTGVPPNPYDLFNLPALGLDPIPGLQFTLPLIPPDLLPPNLLLGLPTPDTGVGTGQPDPLPLDVRLVT